MRNKLSQLVIVLALFFGVDRAEAQGTAFTYQGLLNNSGVPANGLYDFRFRLAVDPEGDTILDTSLTNAILVSNGLFTTTINFGEVWFNGSNYWLELDVRTNNPANTLAYVALSPLQALTPTPYAIFANSASYFVGTLGSANLSGIYSNALTLDNGANQFVGSFTGNGGGLTNLNASQLSSGVIPMAQLPAAVVTNNQAGATLSGTFSGNGSGLTSLSTANLSPGTAAINISGTAATASTATTANNFSGSLAGDVTGTQNVTVVSSVGGQTAANVASATSAANAATSVTVPGTIVMRDSSGNFSAGTISANLTGNATTATTAATALSLVSQQAYALCPPGTVVAYMGSNAPPGWLICDGSLVSRTNYASLFAVIGTSVGSGDGSTTFNLPDMRGIFLRGLNGSRSDSFADPDDNSSFRSNIFTGGNTGNALGSYQMDMFANHSHSYSFEPNVNGFSGEGTSAPRSPYGTANTGAAGGDETRPKNVYVNYIMKY